MKKLLAALCVSTAFAFAPLAPAADASMAATAAAPKSVIHVITVSFKPETKPDQIQAAIDGAHKLPGAYKGITRVWSRVIKNQTDKSHIIVMEFASEQALKDYAESDAQKEWYKLYLPIRQESRTSDITN